MTVSCVVVTYNRLSLLKECLAAVERQTFPIKKIVVIDNKSTDGTEGYLKSLSASEQYRIIRTDSNIGGAGGFSLGLKEAVLDGADYVWMMDDDTIPEPTALEALMDVAASSDRIGYVCSRVNWTDGEKHPRNGPGGLDADDRITTANGVVACRCKVCTFVSVLVSSQAVYKVGLPIKEFFIWFDDIEYTIRITRAGFQNYYVEQSVVVHKTPDVYEPNIEHAPVSMAPRFYYQVRNSCYFKHRMSSNILFFHISVWNRLRLMKRRIRRRKDGHFQEFYDAVKRGCRDGLTFYPQIEYLPKKEA